MLKQIDLLPGQSVEMKLVVSRDASGRYAIRAYSDHQQYTWGVEPTDTLELAQDRFAATFSKIRCLSRLIRTQNLPSTVQGQDQDVAAEVSGAPAPLLQSRCEP